MSDLEDLKFSKQFSVASEAKYSLINVFLVPDATGWHVLGWHQVYLVEWSFLWSGKNSLWKRTQSGSS